MKSNKLKSLVAMATMAGVISMTSTTHQSNKVNKKLLTVKKVDSKDSTSNNINPNDLNIEISNINITKESAVGFTNNSSYVPENNIPKTTNIATSNTEVVYKIAVSLSSKTGKFYKIPKLYLTANPFAQYMGKNANDPKEKEAAAKLLKSINVQLSELKDLNTTSTFVITAIVGVGNADWDVKVNPNFQIHAMVGNKEKVVPIKAPDILLTNHYTDNVYAGLKITHSENNKHESYLDIDLNNGNSAPNNPGIYNPANYKPQSITFKIDNPDSKDIDIIPLKVPGFTVNPDGTYTVDSRLIGQVNRLFKVVTKTNGVLNKEITVVPLSEKYNTNIDLNKTTTFNYDSASATLTQNAIGDSFTMSQGTQASGWYNVYDTFSSKLSAGVPGKYKIYSGSLLSDGNMVVIDGKNLIAIKDQTYVSLNKNAENILLTGTPSEKAAIFQRIVNGDMSGIGQAFSYDKILQMYKSGEELPQINFTYKSEEYNGNPLNMVGYYHEIPIHGAWTPMINRVFTLGVLQGNYSKEEKESMEEAIEKGALSSDTIIKNNGEFSGFLLSPPDNITNQDIYDQKPVEGPVGNGTYYTTESRYGSISHDISSAITYAYEKVTTTIDSPKGAGNIVQNHPVSWLDNSHKFYFYIYGYGSGITEQYTKNTVLNVNMDAPFVLTSPVTINGVTVPKEDYKIEGNRILIRFPQRFNMSPQPRVEFEAHYITFGPQTITVSAHLEGKMGHQGIVYNYNNNPNSSELEGGATSQIVLFNSQVLTGETSNECMHYSNGVDSNGNVTLTDVVHNGKYETKKYFVVGQIPTAGSNNLPGNEGAPSVGGLGSELLSLDTSGAPTWVLPKSALNSINQDILDNTNALDLKGKLKYIESPGSGWVRYIPGQTNLSGMVAYFVTPTIEPGKDFYVNYNVHLTGINRNTYQIVNSAFKYYTPSGNLGSTSNIVNLTPPGENLSYDWISKVVDLNGHAIPSGALSNTINYNGEKISLSNLIGHGPDNDGKSDLTPQELQEKINLATNKEVMKELGYKLDGIYVNGQKVSKEWFNTVGILNNSTLTHVKFVISKVSTDTVKVMEHSTDSNGKELITQVGKTTTTTGAEGTNTGLKTPEIPEGYHIVNITDNGKVITTGVPSKFTGNNQNIVYNIAKNITDKVYVDVKTTTGNILTPSHVVSTGAPGSDTNVNMPEIPKDYHIVKVTVNNKVITQNANGSYNLPKTFSDNKNVEKDDKIEVIVAKNPTTTVEEHYQNGTNVVPSKTTTNLQGAKVNTGLPELPQGYKVIKVTVNGKEVLQSEVPTTQSKDNQTIVYTIGKQPTDTVKVVYEDGKPAEPSVSVTGNTGSKTGLKTPQIPKGYHIVSITNGNGDKVTGVPDTFGNSNNTTIYKIAKNVTDKVYVDVKTITGNILTPSHVVSTGAPGSDTNVNMPEVPKDYHIVKVVVNNKVITLNANGSYNLPKTFSDNKNVEKDDRIEVIVAKNPTTTVEEHYENGTSVVPNKTTTNLQGAKVSTGLPELPSGYKVIKVIVNGKEVSQSEVPTTQSKDNQTIVYTIGKVLTDTVKVMEHSTDSKGKEVTTQVGKTTTVTGVEGTNTGLNTPKIPEGYHIVNITDNGKVITTGVPSKFTGNDQNIVYNIAKNPTTTVEEHYENGTNVVPNKTTTNLQGAKVSTGLPELPKGYQVTKVTVNGKEVPQNEVPTTQSADNQTIVYIIGKQPTDTVKVVYEDGKPAEPSVSVTGNTGSKTGLKTPEIPKGYHIVSITNGNGDKVTGVPDTFGNSNNTTIYKIAKNVTDKVYVDVKTITGNILTPSHVVSTGAPGSDTNVNMPEVPKDYHIVKVVVNNKVITPNANGSYNLPKTFSDNKNVEKDDKIEVIVAKNPTTIVEEHYQNGTSVVPNKTTTNLQGAKVNTGLPELPKGYQVTKITVNGKEVSQNEVPTTQGNDNQIIVYTIGKQPTDTVKVVYEDGKPAEHSVSVTGNTGDKTVLNVPKIPEGYHVVSVTNTTKGVDGIPKTFGNTDNTTTYTIAKNVKDKTYAKVVTDINGKVVTLVPSKQVGSGKPDSKEQVITLKVPEGYKIVKVTINGKEVTPNKDGKYEVTYNSDKNKESDNNIVITVKHVPVQDTVKVVEGDKTISTTTTKPGMPGEDNGITTPNVPTGYHIGNITVDGKTVDKVPTTYGDKDQTIVYHLVENQPNDIKANVVTEDGKTLVKDTIVAKGPEGSEVTCDKTAIPKGYHLDKVLYNGKVISTVTGGKVIYMLPDTIPSGKEGQLTYVVSPDKSSATVTVTDGTKTFSSTTTTGNVGSKITGDTPVIPKGYKVINITVNGQTVSEKDLPKVYGNTPSKIVYHITKIPTGEVKQEVVTTKGTIIEEPTVVANGEVGTDTNLKPYTPPKGYHIVKVIVDGKTLTTKEDKDLIHNLPSIITDKTQTVKYVIGKNVEEKGSLKYEIKINGAPYGSGELQGTPGKTASYDLPHNKYLKLESITVNGRTITTPSDVQNFENYHGKFEPNGVTIIYNYKTVTTPSGSSTSNTTGVGSSTSSSTTKTTIGDNTGKDKAPAVKPSIGKDTDKTTPVKPVTPEHKNNTTKPSTGDNTGKDKTPAVKPSTGKDTDKTTPVKPVSPEHKDKTTVTVNVVGGPKEITIKVTGDVGTLITKDTPTIPKGYKVKNITVNGHTVSEKDLPKVFGKKDIHIVYHITKVPTDKTPEVKPVTPEHKDNTTKPSTGDNTGKDKTPDVKPSTGKDTDKTTPVKPLTPEHKDNKIKPSTGDNTGKDKTPDVKPSIGKDTNKKTDANHNDNKGTAGNEAHTSTSTHATVSGNGEAHSSATAHASANGGEVKTSATSNVNVNHNTPVVNNNGQGNTETGNASSDRTANNTTSTNGSTETPFNSSSVNDSTGSTYTDNNLVNGPNEDNSTAQTVLPHTGFNMQGAEHTAKEAGAIAGIIAMISGLFFFRRKK